MALSDLLSSLARLFGVSPPEFDGRNGNGYQPTGNSALPPPPAPVFSMPSAPVEKPEVHDAPTWLELCRPMTEHFERCRLVSYPDPATGAEPWTCGWGATGPDVSHGTVWTQEQADSRLTVDLNARADQVDAVVKVPLTAAQKAALVDFVYNLGAGNLRASTLLKLLNAGDYQGAADEFPKWNRAAGRVMTGLVKRRKAERDLFLTGTWSPT